MRDDTLKENTAQAVFQALQQIESLAEKSSDRWLWELIQNAVDTARPEGIRIHVEFDNTRVTFRHDGRSFEPKEMAHLVYYGTTKLGEGLIGQFGTGFLSTHILSRRVRVRGRLASGEGFAFNLGRDGDNPEEIGASMDDSWKEFKGSIVDRGNEGTTFEYFLDQRGFEAAGKGLSGVHSVLPFVLAFNPGIREFTLRRDGRTVTWERGTEEVLDSEGHIRAIQVRGEEELIVVVAGGQEIEAAVLLGRPRASADFAVNTASDVPSVFSAFPLRGTTWFRLPCVVNSKAFAATPDRQGLVLGTKETETNLKNKKLLNQAFSLVDVLVRRVSPNYGSPHNLPAVDIPPGGDPDWLEDGSWLRARMREVIQRLRNVPLVITKSSRVAVDSACVPLPDEGLDLSEMFRLASALLQEQTPVTLEETAAWIEILRGWSRVLGEQLPDLSQTLTPANLADRAKALGNLTGLDGALRGSGIGATDWTNAFSKWCKENQEYLDGMLPNQLGDYLRATSALQSDPGLPDELKDIGDLVGYHLRSMLLHRQIVPPRWLGVIEQDTAVAELIRRLQDIGRSLKPASVDEFVQATRKLLAWLVRTEAWSKFESKIPVLVGRRDSPSVNYLVRGERLLAPPSVWHEKARPFAELFPKETVLCEVYTEALDSNGWMALASKELVWADPLFSGSERLDADDIEGMHVGGPLTTGVSHGTSDPVEVTKIAFLALPKDKCVIDNIRSRARAAEFFRFLIDYAIRVDSLWTKAVDVSCKCGAAHAVHPSQFLRYAKLRSWIPTRIENKEVEEHPTTENVLRLLQENGGIPDSLLDERGWEFLTRMDLQPLVFVAPTPEAQQELAKVARAMSDDPEFQAQVQKAVRQKQVVRQNQGIGLRIQELIGVLLAERLTGKWQVTPHYNLPGYDYYLREELDADTDAGRIELANHYLEVKATVESRVGITPTQADFAVKNTDHYSLCVVRILPGDDPGSIPLNLLEMRITIIPKIGDLVRDSLSKISSISEAKIPGQVWVEHLNRIRYAVGDRVWETSGETLLTWLKSLTDEQEAG